MRACARHCTAPPCTAQARLHARGDVKLPLRRCTGVCCASVASPCARFDASVAPLHRLPAVEHFSRITADFRDKLHSGLLLLTLTPRTGTTWHVDRTEAYNFALGLVRACAPHAHARASSPAALRAASTLACTCPAQVAVGCRASPVTAICPALWPQTTELLSLGAWQVRAGRRRRRPAVCDITKPLAVWIACHPLVLDALLARWQACVADLPGGAIRAPCARMADPAAVHRPAHLMVTDPRHTRQHARTYPNTHRPHHQHGALAGACGSQHACGALTRHACAHVRAQARRSLLS